jgi:hypothetical protein
MLNSDTSPRIEQVTLRQKMSMREERTTRWDRFIILASQAGTIFQQARAITSCIKPTISAASDCALSLLGG